MSSAVLAITVIPAAGYARCTPSANFEPPTPPAKITICTAPVFRSVSSARAAAPAAQRSFFLVGLLPMPVSIR
jgi:hypothetical protein